MAGVLAAPKGGRFSLYPFTALSHIFILFPDLYSRQLQGLQWPKRLLQLVLLLELLALPEVG